jgi:hypothetical protein
MNRNTELNRASNASPQRKDSLTALKKDGPELIQFRKFPDDLAKASCAPAALKLNFLIGNRS